MPASICGKGRIALEGGVARSLPRQLKWRNSNSVRYSKRLAASSHAIFVKTLKALSMIPRGAGFRNIEVAEIDGALDEERIR